MKRGRDASREVGGLSICRRFGRAELMYGRELGELIPTFWYGSIQNEVAGISRRFQLAHHHAEAALQHYLRKG